MAKKTKFGKLKAALQEKKDSIKDPEALAAKITRGMIGQAALTKKSVAGRKKKGK